MYACHRQFWKDRGRSKYIFAQTREWIKYEKCVPGAEEFIPLLYTTVSCEHIELLGGDDSLLYLPSDKQSTLFLKSEVEQRLET